MVARMDPSIAVTFDGQAGLSFVQGEDRLFGLAFVNRADGAPINLSSSTVGVSFPRAGGGDVKRSSGALALTASMVTPATGIAYPDHGLVDGDPVTFAGASLPAPLVAATPYLVRVIDNDTFALSDAAGTSITLTTAGSGAFTMTNSSDVTITSAPGGTAALSLRSAVTSAISAGLALDFQVSLTLSGKLRIVVVKDALDVTAQSNP